MALSEGNVILASDFIAIKARVKAECARRKYNGSVEQYSQSAYDYTVIPQDGNVPLPEHFNKIIVPLNAIADTGRTQTQSGYFVRALNDIDTILINLESIEDTASSSGCKASCTGLCQGTCTTGCTGCTGGCSGSCVSGCSYGCSGVCGSQCVYSCYDTCESTCTGYCGSGCADGCLGGCKTICKGTCTGLNSTI